MEQPKFKVGQKVKFKDDHDRLTGEVLSFSYDSEKGYTYKISSKYYDADLHDMVTGMKTCAEDELVDMTNYTGSTTPPIPDKTINVSDQVNTKK
jgi:hypothetical protein